MMKLAPNPNYFSIWRYTFHLLRARAGLLIGVTVFMAAPLFILNGLVTARHIMTLGGASMAGIEIQSDQMQILWGSLVGGDSLVFVALGIVALLIFQYLTNRPEGGFLQHVRHELPRLLFRAGFWLFVISQVAVFMMINSSDGRIKIAGMLLLGCSVLLLLGSQDHAAPAYGKRLRRLTIGGWLSLVLIVLTIPLLYILFNGYVNAVLLLLADRGAQKMASVLSLDMQTPWLPYGVITLSKFLSQWFNLLPMALLLSTCIALRGTGECVPRR